MAQTPLQVGDLLIGGKAIGEVLNAQPDAVWRMARSGLLPHFRLGPRIAVRRSTLAAWIARQEAEAEARRSGEH